MKKIQLTFLMLNFCLVIFAQNFWSTLAPENFPVEAQIQARNANYQHLDITAFTDKLFQAPLKVSKIQLSDVKVNLPMPDGSSEEFMVFEAPIMEEALRLKYPEIKTFIFQSTENLSTYGRADITAKGFHLMLFTLNGSVFIDPLSQQSKEAYIVYNKSDFYTNKELPTCLSEEATSSENTESMDPIQLNKEVEFQAKSTKLSNGSELRTYRIAVSATAEYTQFHGGAVVDGLSAIVTTINRVNSIYERDFTVRLILVGNNDQVIYTDASTDPFDDPTNASQLHTENRISLDATIGNSNYDIGHVVGRSGSGLAGFGVVCSSFSNFFHKANGTTGISNPIGDPFDIDYVAHEIGHQFRASHTFNGSSGSCGTNISTNSAYEPGSGTTIMAYAGICAPQNTQNFSDDHFHNRSFNQVVDFIVGTGNSCAVRSNTGNNIPILNIVTNNNLTIPLSTPFYLEAIASDVDGDVLTYCWEQYDLGNQGPPNSPVGNAPLFRSFSPTIDPIRTFPQLDDILNNTTTFGERLPDYQRDLNFKVTVRDNVAAAGAVIDEEVSISVANNSGPFLVLSPNTSSVDWVAGETEIVTWDVANTNNAPVSCATVDIVLSTNGGQTYPIVLASGVPNNGTFAITVPFALTDQARVKIVCTSNIFFDISNQDFDILANCAGIDASINITEQIENAIFCLNANGELSIVATSPDLVITTYEWFHNNIAIPNSNSSSITIANIQNSNAGDYYCSISNGCNTVLSNTANVTVSSNLIIPIITEISSGVLESSLSSGNQWYLNGNPLLGETEQQLTINQTGTYTVSSVAGPCSASSNSISTAINDFSAITSILIHPNPSKGIFNIEVANWDKDIFLEVKDVLGKTIITSFNFQKQTKLDLTSLSNGMYLVKLSSENYSSTYKILKK